jgi:hypothetical protein
MENKSMIVPSLSLSTTPLKCVAERRESSTHSYPRHSMEVISILYASAATTPVPTTYDSLWATGNMVRKIVASAGNRIRVVYRDQ